MHSALKIILQIKNIVFPGLMARDEISGNSLHIADRKLLDEDKLGSKKEH